MINKSLKVEEEDIEDNKDQKTKDSKMKGSEKIFKKAIDATKKDKGNKNQKSSSSFVKTSKDGKKVIELGKKIGKHEDAGQNSKNKDILSRMNKNKAEKIKRNTTGKSKVP